MCDLRQKPDRQHRQCLRTGRIADEIADGWILQQKLASIVDTYLDVQQDILKTFVDRGQLQKLTQPTVLANGKRIPA
jgi:hypothetical protein